MPESPYRERRPPDAAPLAQGGWRRLMRAGRPRATKANALAAALSLLLGFALVTQVRQTRSQGLDALRQSDLVRVLADVNQRSARLDAEARTLQATNDQLAGGSSGEEAALAAAQQRLETLRILAGTVAAHGPGIRLSIDDPARKVSSSVLLDALEELRDAGAESVQLGPVRVVAGSYLSDVPSAAPAGSSGAATSRRVSIDGTVLSSPYVFRAIGDAQTLASAMQIPGGLTESVRQMGATPTVTQVRVLSIDALHTIRQARYAQRVRSSASAR